VLKTVRWYVYHIKDKDIANHIYTSLPATVQKVAKVGSMVKGKMVVDVWVVRNMMESKRVVEMGDERRMGCALGLWLHGKSDNKRAVDSRKSGWKWRHKHFLRIFPSTRPSFFCPFHTIPNTPLSKPQQTKLVAS
jgi:hypothetical protein